LPAVGVCAALAFAMLIFTIVSFNNYIDYATGYRTRTMEHILLAEIADATTFTTVTAQEAASNHEVVAAFQARDIDEMRRLLTRRNDFDRGIYYTVLDADAIVLLRTENANAGDSKADVPSIQRALAGETVTLNEAGAVSNLSIRTNTPILDNNDNVIGVIASAVRFDNVEYLDRLQSQHDIDVVVYLHDTVVASTLIGNQRLNDQIMDADIYQALFQQRMGTLRADRQISGIPFHTFFTTLNGYDGQPLAVIMIGSSAAGNQAVINSTILGLILMTGVGVALTAIIMAFVSRQITNPVKRLVNIVRQLRHGKVDIAHDNVKIPNDEIGELTKDAYRLGEIVQGLSSEIIKFSHMLIVEGDIEYRIPAEKYSNTYKEMMDGINGFLDDFADDMLYFIGELANITNGKFNVEIRPMPGKKMILPQTMQGIRDILISFNDEILALAQNAAHGNLKSKVDKNKYTGNWNEIASTLNSLLSSVEEPLTAMETALSQMKQGEFKAAHISSDYNGVFDTVKSALNDTSETVLSYIDEIAITLKAMSAGDLTATTKLQFIGAYKPIQTAIITIQQSLNQILSDINESSTKVAQHSQAITSSAQMLAQGAQLQSSSIQEISASVNVIYEKALESNNSTIDANTNAAISKQHVEQGNLSVQTMTDTMNEIKAASDSISTIISVITDISFQTNLLALNASVEAARAGEHGKGFAVVAEEVRNLAGRSQQSASDTGGLIEKSSNSVTAGIKANLEVVSSFDSIASNIVEISEIISKISAISTEQLGIIERVNANVNEITRVVMDNSASAEQSAAAAEELSEQAELLREKVGYFRLV